MLREHLNDGVALWAAIKARHVRDQPASRYNSYIELMSMELKDGEPLAAFDACVHNVMRHVKLHHPTAFTLADLDKELISMVVLPGLSRHTSCSVTRLYFAAQRHAQQRQQAQHRATAAEDMNCQAAPVMYGLAADAEGVCVHLLRLRQPLLLQRPTRRTASPLAAVVVGGYWRRVLVFGFVIRLVCAVQVRLLQRQPLDERLLQEADR